MAKKVITIESILDGWQISDSFGGKEQFLSSIGIDPDMPKTDSDKKPSGLLRPTSMGNLSSVGEITGNILWFVKNPKTDKIYAYADDGKVHTIDADLTMGTALNSGSPLADASGNGAEYYDNYNYFARENDVARYGPLNGSASLVQDYWTSTLGLTALVNKAYPSINGVTLPNHPMHRHTDDKLYFGDVNSNNKGILSYVKTTKTTVEGDTDDTSVYEALDFDFGFYTTTIESYGNDLAVGLIEGVEGTRPAKISFWDTSSVSFNKITDVELFDPLITAMRNVNGNLYVFSGSSAGGCRVSVFLGGYTIQEIAYLPDEYPPISQGAVDHILSRIAFGSAIISDPEAAAAVFAIGGKQNNFLKGIHAILRPSNTGNNPIVTAICYPEVNNGGIIQPIVAWKDDSAKGIDKLSTTYGNYNVWKSTLYRVGSEFKIKKFLMPLVQAVAANMVLKVKIISADGADTETIATINNTNFPSSEQLIKLFPTKTFINNFYLQLEWEGSALLTVGLPIIMEIETLN